MCFLRVRNKIYFKTLLQNFTSKIYFKTLLQNFTSKIYFKTLLQKFTSKLYFNYLFHCDWLRGIIRQSHDLETIGYASAGNPRI